MGRFLPERLTYDERVALMASFDALQAHSARAGRSIFGGTAVPMVEAFGEHRVGRINRVETVLVATQILRGCVLATYCSVVGDGEDLGGGVASLSRAEYLVFDRRSGDRPADMYRAEDCVVNQNIESVCGMNSNGFYWRDRWYASGLPAIEHLETGEAVPREHVAQLYRMLGALSSRVSREDLL